MDTYSIAFSLPRSGSLLSSAGAASIPSMRSTTRAGLGEGAFMPGKDDAAHVQDPSPLGGSSGSLSDNYKKDLRAYLDNVDNGASCHVKVTQEKRGEEAGSTSLDPDAESVVHDLPEAFADGACLSFHITGSDKDAKQTRSTVYRHFPRPARYTLQCSPAHVLNKSTEGGLELEVVARQRIEAIASATRAKISVVNRGAKDASRTVVATIAPAEVLSELGDSSGNPSPARMSSSGDVTDGSKSNGEKDGKVEWVKFTYGHEQSRTCELDITGTLESVERAKVRLLVLLDELHGLDSRCIEIKYKLHNLIAGRLRKEADLIQKKTGTNIYFPTPLVGVFDVPPTSQEDTESSSPSSRNTNGFPSSDRVASQGQLSVQSTGQVSNGDHLGPNSALHHDQYAHARNHNQNHGHAYPSYHPGPYQHMPPHGLHPQHTRPPPYQYYGHGPMQPGPISANHTGMSQMSQMQVAPMSHIPNNGYRNNRGGMPIRAPSPNMQAHPGFHGQPQHHGQYGYPPNGMYDASGMNMAYQGATHMHVGLPGGFMGGPPNGMGHGHPRGYGNGHHGGQLQNVEPQMEQFSAPGADTDIHRGEQGELGPAMEVWITGEFFGVQRARDLLQEKAMAKESMVIHRSMTIHPLKNDWLLTEHMHDLRAIMIENGTYIQMPVVGSYSTNVVVFGDHPTPVIRTLRQMANLTCHYSEASVSLIPAGFDPIMPASVIMPSHMEPILKSIAHDTGAEVIFRNNVFEAHGREHEVKEAVRLMLATDVVKSYNTDVEFKLEIAKGHKEFLEGKKRGKFNKISRNTGVRFDEFTRVNDFNKQLRVSGRGADVLAAMDELEKELPAEVSFHVPDKDHRRIIGQSGLQLKQIMERYNVFIRFHDRSELDPEGGLANTEDNCLVLTPAKKADNLEAAKGDINDHCLQDKNFVYERVKIPRQYHRNLVSEQSAFIENIQRNTLSVIRFPPKELGSDVVLIFGPEEKIHNAVVWLQELVPFEAEVAFPHSQDLVDLAASEDFSSFVKRTKDEIQIDVLAPGRHVREGSMVFKLQCQLSTVDFVVEARQRLEEFIKARGIQVVSGDAEAFSFSDHFGHFQNKAPAARVSSERPAERAPVAPATQNVRALFDNAAQGAQGAIGSRGPTPAALTGGFPAPQQNGHQRGGFGGPGPIPRPGPWNGAGGGFGRGRFHGNPSPGSNPNPNANAGFGHPNTTFNGFGARPPVTQTGGFSLNLDGSASPWAAAPTPPTAPATQTSTVATPAHEVAPIKSATESSKRESDPLLADRARAAQSHSARSLSARTQSLDITALNYRRAVTGPGAPGAPIGTGSTGSGNGFGGPIPPSPTLGGSPNTASASYFPGHRVRGSLSRPTSTSFDARMDGISRGMAGVQISHPQ